MQLTDKDGNVYGWGGLEIIGPDGKPKVIDKGLTSVGLSMPSAFTVSNSPLTSNGTIGVIGAGTTSQYIDGTGALRTFPGLTGFVPYIGATQDVNLGIYRIAASAFVKAGGTSTEFLKADGSIDSNTYLTTGAAASTYVPLSRTLTINGTAYDLSADRSWAVGTVTNIAMTVPTGLTVTGSPITGTGTFAVGLQSGYSIPTTTNQSNWTTAYNRSIVSAAVNYGVAATSLVLTQQNTGTITAGLIAGGATTNDFVFFNGSNLAYTQLNTTAPLSFNGATKTFSISQAGVSTDGFLSSTDWNTFNNKQPAGNYITALSGEATGSGPGTASVTLNNASVTAKVLTGVNVTGGSINASDSILTAFGKLQNQINGLIGSSIYQGTWNALTNNPPLTSGVGTRGYYYIVNVAGSTNLDGITDWNVGDWAIFDGTAWQQVDNTDSVTSVNGQTGAVSLTSDNIPEGATNLYFTNLRARQALSLTTSGSSGASTYDNSTGILNVPNYTLSGLGGVPTSRRLEINGVSYDLSADRSWSVGTVTAVTATGPLSSSGGTTPNITISQASGTDNGYLSSTDWTTFNNKQNAITLTTTGSSGAATLIGSTLNIPNYSSALSGYVPTSRQLTINGTSYDLSADRSWDVGTVTSIGVTAGPRIVSEDGPITSSGNITISHGIGQGLDVQGAQDLMNRSIEDGGSFEAFRCLATSLGELGDFETPLGTFNSIGTVIQNIMLDEFGHILGIGSKTLYTSDIIEDTNLYFTDARARAAISLTTTGTGGAATYNNSTGVLNIPQYQSVITNPVTGTGTANYVARWTSSSQIGTGVLYDNGTSVGIGTTSPQGKLDITGTNGSDLFYLDAGINTDFAFKILSGANDALILRRQHSTQGDLSIASFTYNGNVGIGTNTPGDKLTVDGNINSRNTALFFGDGSDNSASVFATGGPVKFFANSSERMRINSVGQLLVGTTSGYSSNGKIVVQNGTIAAGSSNWNNSTTGNAIEVFGDINSNGGTIWSLANGNQVWGNISISPLGGNVGIGTYTPSQKLHVAGNILSSNVIYWNNGVGALSWDTGLVTMETNSATAIAFNTNSSERMRITSAGRLGIGTTTPGYVLEVNGGSDTFVASFINSSAAQSFIRVGDTSDLNYSGLALYSDSGSGQIFKNGTGSNSWGGNASLNIYNSNGSIAFHPNNTANAMFIATNGNVGIGTTAPSQKLHVSGNLRVTGAIYDSNNTAGTSGQVLSSTGSGTDWVSLSEISGVDGTGTVNYVAKWSDTDTIANSQIFDNGTNVGINNATPKTKLDINGTIGFGSKSMSITDVFATALTLNINDHNGCYVKITAFGDWGNHSTIAYLGEFFIQASAGGYNEPGIIIRQVDNTGGGDDIQAQIVDPAGTGTRDFVIQLKSTSSSFTPFTAHLQYEVRGMYNSVS